MNYLSRYFNDEKDKGNITEKENKVLQYIDNYYDPDDDQLYEFKSIAKDTGISFDSLKGVIASLSKKGYVEVSVNPFVKDEKGDPFRWVGVTDKYRELWLSHE